MKNGVATQPASRASSGVAQTLWTLLGLSLLLVWSLLGIFVLAFLGGPIFARGSLLEAGRAPLWFAYVGAVFLYAVWPLALALVTLRLRALNRGLISGLYVAAVANSLSAVSVALGFGETFSVGGYVIMGRTLAGEGTLGYAGMNVLAALLLAGAALLGGWANKYLNHDSAPEGVDSARD